MTSVKAVIWDMDGVLVDTGEAHYAAWTAILAVHNIPFSRESFRETFGMNNVGVLRQLLGDRFSPDLCAEISDQKEACFRAAVQGQVELLPGVRQLLEALHERGIPQAIASSAPEANIDTIVAALELRPLFGAIVSAAETPGKPDPAVFLTAAQRLNVPPSQCLVIEDAIAGVQAAHNAGMKCVAVTTTNPAAALQEADLVVNRLDELSAEQLLSV